LRHIQFVSICADKSAIGIPKPSSTHFKGPKNGFAPCFEGGRPLQNSTKTDFDPEDGRFSPYEQTFSESTRKTGLMTWARGVKTILRPLQGVQKRISPFCGGVGSYKTPEKPILTLKIVDSALQEEIMICWLNDMGFKTMLHPLQA
jgi:hypothetical protein